MSSTVELPGVNSAIEHLQELGGRMKNPEYGFIDEDLELINEIAKSVRDLEEDRRQAHELLETENIKASVLRHKLMYFPGHIKAEITQAVDAARQSNAVKLKELQGNLQVLDDSIAYLEDRSKVLERENATLHPERDVIRGEHELVISQLNQRMADKANTQISLNETRDNLRDVNQKVVDLETGIVILKEDMIQERADARQEKKQLKQSLHDTNKKVRKQKEDNRERRKELDKLKEEIVESDGKLEVMKKSLKRHQQSKARLEKQYKQHVEQLASELAENEDLKKKGAEIYTAVMELELEYDAKIKSLKDNIKKLDSQTELREQEKKWLEKEKSSLATELKAALEVRNYEGGIVRETTESLLASKEELTSKAGEIAQMNIENDEMEQHIEQLTENHEATVQMLTKQIEDFKESLNRERKERMELQERSGQSSRELEDFRVLLAKTMQEMNGRINSGKKQHNQLTAEGTQLAKSIQKDEAELKQLQVDVQEAQQKYQEMEDELTTEVSLLQRNITEVEQEMEEKQKIIEEKEPECKVMEDTFETKTVEYDNLKKDIIDMRNKKSGLEDSTVRAKNEIERLSRAQVQMKTTLAEKRAEYLQQMKRQNQEVLDVENRIFHSGRKLRAVTEENQRFEKAIEKMESETKLLTEQEEIILGLRDVLKSQLIEQRAMLEEGWLDDKEMERENSKRDQAFLEEITDLKKRTDKREQKITEIAGNLERELVVLTDFLENISSRRPIDTRQSSRSRASNLSTPRPPTELRNYLEARKPETPMDQLEKVKEEIKDALPSPKRTPVVLT